MKIRPYNLEQDHVYIYNALLSEGLSPEEMTFETDNTIITDIGFFSYIKEPHHRYPYLHHFYVDNKHRTLKNFLRLSKAVKGIMFSMGFLLFVVQEPKDKPYLGQFIKFLRGIRFYEEDGHTYYLVPIFKEGIKKL